MWNNRRLTPSPFCGVEVMREAIAYGQHPVLKEETIDRGTPIDVYWVVS